MRQYIDMNRFLLQPGTADPAIIGGKVFTHLNRHFTESQAQMQWGIGRTADRADLHHQITYLMITKIHDQRFAFAVGFIIQTFNVGDFFAFPAMNGIWLGLHSDQTGWICFLDDQFFLQTFRFHDKSMVGHIEVILFFLNFHVKTLNSLLIIR